MPATQYSRLDGRLLIVGFGSIGQAMLPMLMKHLAIRADQISIISAASDAHPTARDFGIELAVCPLTESNYQSILRPRLRQGDFLLNLSVCVSSLALIELCWHCGALYLDTCIEPWEGAYTDTSKPVSLRSNYALREEVLAFGRAMGSGPTAVLTQGANPGLASTFVKQALLNVTAEAGTLHRAHHARRHLGGNGRVGRLTHGQRQAGLSAALELATRGYSVVLLEAQRLGWGASGRNGGQVIAGYGFGGEDAIEAQMSAEDVRRTWDISVDSIALLHQRIAQHAIACDFVPGYLGLAVNARKARALHARVDYMAQAYNYPIQMIAAKDIRSWIASERFHAGAFDPGSGHLHPLKYCLGLADAARAAGVRMLENSAVTGLQRTAKPTVRTQAGEVSCSFVVLAGNVYLGEYGRSVAPEIAARIMPAGT